MSIMTSALYSSQNAGETSPSRNYEKGVGEHLKDKVKKMSTEISRKASEDRLKRCMHDKYDKNDKSGLS
jgi:hypothetical protein